VIETRIETHAIDVPGAHPDGTRTAGKASAQSNLLARKAVQEDFQARSDTRVETNKIAAVPGPLAALLDDILHSSNNAAVTALTDAVSLEEWFLV
jgi:hypothetical protein